MPNCAVKRCGNQTTRDKKEHGITFHIFPTRDQRTLEKWISFVRACRRKPAWTPGARTVLCSAHFHPDDFYYTAKGLRRVKKYAFPKIQYPDSPIELPSSASTADAPQPSPVEEQSPEPPASPTTWLEIKEEVLWSEEQNCVTEDASQEPTVGKPPAEGETSSEDPQQIWRKLNASIQQLRGELGALKRVAEVGPGLERLRGEVRELARGDEFDAFGRYVASLLRGMRPRRAQQAQPLIINLLAAEMIKTDEDDT